MATVNLAGLRSVFGIDPFRVDDLSIGFVHSQGESFMSIGTTDLHTNKTNKTIACTELCILLMS